MVAISRRQLIPEPAEHHGGRILLVDDDPGLLRLLSIRLRAEQYDVEAVESASEALAMLPRFRPDLVITDMTMPDMTGDVLARKIIAIRPDMPIIVCTGYSEKINADVIREIGIRELALKPIIMKDIVQMIERVLSKDGDRRNQTAEAG